jgi:hypothetical protein
LGNASPREKIEKLKGPLDKEIQNSHYVREFVRHYGPYAEAWTRERIYDRARKMAKQAYEEVWRIT